MSLYKGHPSGKRRRAGFVIDDRPQVIHVNEDQEKVLRADKHIRFHKSSAVAEKRMEEQDYLEAKEDEKMMTKKEIIACLLEMGLEAGKDFDKQSKKADLLALYTSLDEQS